MKTLSLSSPTELLAFQKEFLESRGTLHLDLFPAKNEENKTLEVNTHTTEGKLQSCVTFENESEAQNFIDYLIEENTLTTLKTLSQQADAAQLGKTLYLITNKGLPTSAEFGKTDPKELLLELEPFPNAEGETIRIHREELLDITTTENLVYLHAGTPPLQFLKLTPIKIPQKELFAFIQEGGSSGELYLQTASSKTAAEELQKSCAEASYRTSPLVTFPGDLPQEKEILDACEALLDASTNLEYRD